MSSFRIAIIGAGPAGLTLARLLQVNNIPCTVFELEPSPDSRNQGGTIDLHRRGGQVALDRAGLLDEFQKISRPEGQYDKLVKFDGTLILDEKAEMPPRPDEILERPEIDRVKLREMLLDSLKPGTVVWGKKFVKVEESSTKSGNYNLHFADGIEEGFDVVVGADGAWSRVRPFLTQEKPFYSGISAIELWALDVSEKNPWLSDYVGDGSLYMFDEGRAIMCQRNGSNSIRTYVCLRQPENWYKDCGIDWSNPEEAQKELFNRYFANCGEDLKRCVLSSKDALIPRSLYMLPISMKWTSHSGVTLIGDSAHLLTPFAGVGVNLAMTDALELADAIIACGNDRIKIGPEIMAFAEKMFQRSGSYAQKTWDGMQQHFSPTGGEERAAKFRARVAALTA
jgi:2-polyprenyl-6-methoxyphenol hydroxylase-like FAD-dependent oxidoreductase